MRIESWQSTIRQLQVIAVIRASQFELGLQMARAVALGGIHVIEITWNSDRAPDLIYQLGCELSSCMIGAGTLLTVEQQQQAISAGAQFLFTPHVDASQIQVAVEHNIPIVTGALSPTEIVQAWQAGAASVKVFPVQALGGVGYIQSLQGPLGSIPLIPTGGVTLENTQDFLQAGAIAVGLSSDLFPKQAVQQGDWAAIANRAQALMHRLQPLIPSPYSR
ncbi:MAG: bifunctional 4-hydroxy-2-oxoglutarate aldolase/2-dehydro-3-deoxy-phosphogluconate aldolase [Leptolyngbyaceae cyanobacterium RU_5_1]|nr:bifunctional 4-hydroxy-2-oxoglutarate aldolase/2-dehydro-3-deoxy-phosphogluconate aldolase [Leptolyngbyaceae cyanobacterium RU_5_1]